jgi:hypothetical protein
MVNSAVTWLQHDTVCQDTCLYPCTSALQHPSAYRMQPASFFTLMLFLSTHVYYRPASSSVTAHGFHSEPRHDRQVETNIRNMYRETEHNIYRETAVLHAGWYDRLFTLHTNLLTLAVQTLANKTCFRLPTPLRTSRTQLLSARRGRC